MACHGGYWSAAWWLLSAGWWPAGGLSAVVFRRLSRGWSVGVQIKATAGCLLEGNAKCDLVLRFVIVLIAPPIGFEFVTLCNCIPVIISTATFALHAFFILVLGF